MIKNVASHQEYQGFVKEYLSVLYLARGQLSVLLLFKDVFTTLWLTDLSPALPHFTGLYAASGRPARDPVALFRSLLLKRVLKVKSLDEWVKRMRSFPLWAILSGFLPGWVCWVTLGLCLLPVMGLPVPVGAGTGSPCVTAGSEASTAVIVSGGFLMRMLPGGGTATVRSTFMAARCTFYGGGLSSRFTFVL